MLRSCSARSSSRLPAVSVLPGVIHIDLPWTNVWALHNDKDVSLIDSGTRQDRRAILHLLVTSLPAGFRVSNVLLTHGHCDHAGNAAFLCEKFGSKLFAGRREEPFIATRKTYIPPGIGGLSPKGLVFAAAEVLFPVKRRAVDVCIQDGDEVATPIGNLRVVDTPGHTVGHISFYHEERGILFSGDALLTVIPFTRRGGMSIAPQIFSTDRTAARNSVRRLAELNPSALLAGHGWPWVEDTACAVRNYADSLPE
jgi:glyoxylase-like metal-dependent hydrolase (beta-lactamase superfamily II)